MSSYPLLILKGMVPYKYKNSWIKKWDKINVEYWEGRSRKNWQELLIQYFNSTEYYGVFTEMVDFFFFFQVLRQSLSYRPSLGTSRRSSRVLPHYSHCKRKRSNSVSSCMNKGLAIVTDDNNFLVKTKCNLYGFFLLTAFWKYSTGRFKLQTCMCVWICFLY